MEITNVMKRVGQSASQIGPIIKEHGFEEYTRYNKNNVVDSSAQEESDESLENANGNGDEKELKQIADTFTDTLDMIKGSVVRESKLDHGQKVKKLKQIQRRSSEYQYLRQQDTTFASAKRSSDLDTSLLPARPRFATNQKYQHHRARPSERTTPMMASGFPSVKSFSPERANESDATDVNIDSLDGR